MRILRPALAGALVLTGLAVAPALAATTTAAACAPADAPGGEWRAYGHDLHNTRSQPEETTIDASSVVDLGQAFRIDSTDESLDGGAFQNTPVVADGCVFGANTAGWVFAANADTGAMVWKTRIALDEGEVAGGDGVIIGSVNVDGGDVYAVVNQKGSPFLVALDQATGAESWRATVDFDPTTQSYGSPIVWRDVVAFGLLGDPAIAAYRGGVAIVDRVTHEVHVTPVIPDAEFCQDPKCHVGYAGGSVWSTGAIDGENGYAYYGTGNPSAAGPQHRNTNSIIKVDIDGTRATFGDIVGVYEGNPDSLTVREIDEHPVCRQLAPEVAYPANSPMCTHLDLDFGSSPNLFADSSGRLLVGDLQKSGRYHAADASTMAKAWEAVVGAPCFPCNAASSAFDGERILAVGAPPGQLFGLGRDDGSTDWVAPVADGLHYDAVSAANGLAYTFDGETLHAYDSTTGREVATHPLAPGATNAGDDAVPEEASDRAVAGMLNVQSGGVAIARNTLYVSAGGAIVALRAGVVPPTEPPVEQNPPYGAVEGGWCVTGAAFVSPATCELTTHNPRGAYASGFISAFSGTFTITNVDPGCRIAPGDRFATGGDGFVVEGDTYTYTASGFGVGNLNLDDACTYRLTLDADGIGFVYAGQVN